MAAKPEVGRWGEGEPRDRLGPRHAAGPEGSGAFRTLEDLAWVLDSSIEIPGIRFRIGLDSMVGLVPVLGDVLGAAISAYILWLGARMGATRATLLRMSLNVALEALAGTVPLLGDVFDMAWKANRRNVELLKAHARDPERARRSDRLFAVLLILALLAVVGLLAWGAYALGRAAFSAVRG